MSTHSSEKICSRDDIAAWLVKERSSRALEVGFTSGVFDLVHPGHIDYLERARQLGDYLIVGVNSDDSVRALKGPSRPIVPGDDRARVIASLSCVDRVFIFSDANNRENINALKPDIYIKGGDYAATSLSSAELVRSYGGRVELIPFLKGYSSSAIIERVAHSALGIAVPSPSKRYETVAPAIFLDRDGVINTNGEYVNRPEDFHIIEGVPEAIKLFNSAGYRIVVVTNQPGIGLGYYSIQDFSRIMKVLLKACGERGAMIDRIYYCPHSLSEGCECRKPGTEMFRRAERELNIDLAKSFMIGDMTSDILAGNSAGCRTVLVETGMGGRDGLFPDTKPHMRATNLRDAAERIIKGAL